KLTMRVTPNTIVSPAAMMNIDDALASPFSACTRRKERSGKRSPRCGMFGPRRRAIALEPVDPFANHPTPTVFPLPSGRGREAMTYGRALWLAQTQSRDFAVVSHLVELVRGASLFALERPPHSFGHLLPKGFSCERTWVKMCGFDSGRGGVHG